MFLPKYLAAVSCFMLWTTTIQASPIIYAGALTSGVTVTGSNSQPSGSEDNPVGAEYYSFTATAGDTIDIFGDRLVGGYDMSFWVLDGVYTDTTEIIGGSFPGTQALFSRFADDEDPPNIAGSFGDPHETFVAPFTGSYTVAVTNFASAVAGPYPFELTMVAVPEPTTLGVLSIGAIGMVARAARRRRQRKPDA